MAKTQKINREFNQPNLQSGSKPPKTVTLGKCRVCGKPVVVAAWVAKLRPSIGTCSRACATGIADEEEEAI